MFNSMNEVLEERKGKLENVQIRTSSDYDDTAVWYDGHMEQAADAMVGHYASFVRMIAEESDRKPVDVARHCMAGPECGMGDTVHNGMRDVVYGLTHMVSGKIRAHNWS